MTSKEIFVMVTHDYSPEIVPDSKSGKRPHKKQKTENSDRLQIKKGQVLKLLHKDDSGWWWGQVYNQETKELEGSEGWFPSTYVKHFYSSSKPESDPELKRLAENPADLIHLCYTTNRNAAQALALSGPSHFKGLPLLESVKDTPEPHHKEVRLMNHYFDYDHWNEHMNKIHPSKRKGKADPKLKKPKKIRW